MKTNEIKDSVSVMLEAHFKGFKYKKKNFEYVRSNRGFVYIFRVGLHFKNDWHLVTPEIFVGSPKLNKLFNDALDRNISVNGSTWGFAVRNKFNTGKGFHRGHYIIDDKNDIPIVVSAIKLDFEEVALPVFDEIKTIHDIEREFNKKDECGKYHPASVSYACLGIAAAHLIQNPNFDQICEDYYSFFENSQGEKLAIPIQKMIKYLEKVF